MNIADLMVIVPDEHGHYLTVMTVETFFELADDNVDLSDLLTDGAIESTTGGQQDDRDRLIGRVAAYNRTGDLDAFWAKRQP